MASGNGIAEKAANSAVVTFLFRAVVGPLMLVCTGLVGWGATTLIRLESEIAGISSTLNERHEEGLRRLAAIDGEMATVTVQLSAVQQHAAVIDGHLSVIDSKLDDMRQAIEDMPPPTLGGGPEHR